MDASASKTNCKDIFGFYALTSAPLSSKHKNSVSKYTRLPDFDFDNKVSWSQKDCITEPRLRRIISVEEPLDDTTKSLKSNVAIPPKKMTSSINRKVITIEDNNVDLQSKTYSGELKSSAKKNIFNDKNSINSSKFNYKNKYSKFDSEINVLRKKKTKQDNVQIIQSVNMSPKMTIEKKPHKESESVKEIIYDVKNKLNNVLKKNNLQVKSRSNIQQSNKSASKLNKVQAKFLNSGEEKNKPISVGVQVSKEINMINDQSNISKNKKDNFEENKSNKVDHSIITNKEFISKDVGTEPLCNTVDHETEMSDEYLTCNDYGNILSYDRSNKIFDSLDIPNVSLRKDKDDLPKDEIVNFFSKSMPNIRVPALNMISLKETQNEQIKESLICNNNSYIISRATVTYTSKQKIDFQVVENHDNKVQNHLRSSPLNYPISVVSVFKKELSKRDCDNCTEYNKNTDNNNYGHERDVTLNCPLVFDSDELKKPSDIISTIKVENSLLQNSSSCEQFQRELNFIDSFFESLQYLETCSLSDKSFTENNVENWINNSYNFDCGSFLSKFENDVCADENETMASKSLCRLNLLIRHEQRRAKNLLFVLKMREDALKDFTKSQILWLENKKKQENIDISTLKKKQRGALLKWQHECGEMQRIRKALLTRTEKRKIVLMKTKKNLEWKLENNLDVEKIILGKKKVNRVRSIAPVKCFDLSSSGCDDSTTSRPKSNTPVFFEREPKTGVEKCIQTGDSIMETINRDKSLDIANEHFIVVDGGFLNIIFRDLSLPQIFSDGKQYEVNEEAIKNILNSSQSHSPVDNGSAVEKLMDHIKNHEAENSSSPSTARSLVEEFDQYYKGLLDEEQDTTGRDKLDEEVASFVQKPFEVHFAPAIEGSHDRSDQISHDDSMAENSLELLSPKEALNADLEPKLGVCVAGPLPVPAGAAAVNEPATLPSWSKTTLTYADTLGQSVSPMVVPALATSEAEELRRQELAIEREIKAIEQQQCQFLVVREIPDKPPPPYTPPIETRPPKPPRSFSIDITTKERIRKYITEPDSNSDSDLDAFKLFVKDFCKDSMSRQKAEQSDKVWDTCCTVLPKPQPDTEKLVNRTALDLKEVLTCVTPTVLSGVGARRSDLIDDILFAEWRRCEPEWTSLHTDEIIVKNQLCDSVFDKILTEAIDDYKKTVMAEN